ncbi:hypothetical protein D3C84_1312560 [compost metagenome]
MIPRIIAVKCAVICQAVFEKLVIFLNAGGSTVATIVNLCDLARNILDIPAGRLV